MKIFLFALATLVATSASSSPLVIRSADETRIVHASGFLAPATGGDPATAARLFLAGRGSDFGVSGRETLAVRSAPPEGTAGAVRFERRIDGLPVLNGGINVLVGAGAEVLGVESADVARVVSGRFAMSEAAASARATAAIRKGSISFRSSKRGWWSNGTATRAAYEVQLGTLDPAGAWKVLVDAEDGRILFIDDLLTRTTGRVYDLSPAEPTAGTVCGLDGGGYRTMCAPTELRTLPNLTSATTLTGSQARAYNCRGNDYPAAAGSTIGCDQDDAPTADAYDFTPDATGVSSSDAFAAVMGYYHVDRHVSWLKALDPSVAGDFFALPVFVNAYSGGAPYDNAHFSGLTNSIVLGQGARVDYAYDASVLYHELNHGAVAMLGGFIPDLDANGVLEEPSAVNEGVADALAYAHTQVSRIGYFVGNWGAASNPPPYMRDMVNRKTCAGTGTVTTQLGVSGVLDGIDGEVHDDGEIWNGVFSELYQGLKDVPACNGACDAATAIQYKAIELASGTSPTLGSFAQTAVSAAQALFPDRPTLNAFVQCVMNRHQMSTCNRTFDLYAGEAKIQYVRFRYGGFQFKVHTTGVTTFKVCSVGGTAGDLWARSGAPVQLTSPALTGPTTTPTGSLGPFAIDTCANGGTELTTDATPATFYLLVDSEAAGPPSSGDIFAVVTSPTNMAARPAAAALPTCSYAGEVPGGGGGTPAPSRGGGGGCSQAGASAGPLALLAVLLLARRRRVGVAR